MPKKTKKEKILASYHKKIRLLENRQINNSPLTISSSEIKTKTVIDEPLKEELKNTNQYFFSDLKKSLLLITIIIGVEVALYFMKFVK
mgnify:CR=1 FL=1